jgi:hypothetical protein
MAKAWSEVEKSQEYQALPPAQKAAAKQEYWDTIVTNKPEFRSLPPVGQLSARTQFFGGTQTQALPNSQQAIIGKDPKTGKPIYDQVSMAYLKAQAVKSLANPISVQTQQQKDIGVLDVKRKTYTKDLESFFAVDDVLQEARGKGLGRIEAGGKMVWEGFKQDSTLGRAVAVHDAARKRLRVQLVRAAGDVGNINIVEQKAAEMLIPTQWDDAQTAELKRAYLLQIGKAIGDNDGNAVKETLSSFMGTPVYQSNLETIKAGGKTYKIPKDEVADFKKAKGIK